ncbi:hypothetical protein [Streptomyces sp. NPDC002825]|uniref:hypothetical protein n=1 Tax=Streptomyces sp. NPDC002825 TaxID=3154666 RepID=UPI0033238E3A
MKRRAAMTALAVSTMVAGVLVGGAGSAAAAHQYTDRLVRGESLGPGEYITRWINDYSFYQLVMQRDGNLVEYKGDVIGDRQVCWAANTQYSGYYAIYQNDGNFVVYPQWSTRAVWSSNSQWGSGSTVDINGSGVVYVGTKPITGSC